MRKADNLPLSCAVVTKSGSLNFLEPSGSVQACNGIALPLSGNELWYWNSYPIMEIFLVMFKYYRELSYCFCHCDSLNDIQFYFARYSLCEMSLLCRLCPLTKRRNFKERLEVVGT